MTTFVLVKAIIDRRDGGESTKKKMLCDVTTMFSAAAPSVSLPSIRSTFSKSTTPIGLIASSRGRRKGKGEGFTYSTT
jgi:hypothetical protein